MSKIKSMNLSLLKIFEERASMRNLNWTVDKKQNGKLISSKCWVRNGTGNEEFVQACIDVDDESNVAYVYIKCKAHDKTAELQQKLTDMTGVEEINPEMMGWKSNDKHYVVNSLSKFYNNGNITKWADEIFEHVISCLKIVSEVVY